MPSTLTKQTVRLTANPVRDAPNGEDPAWRAWQAHVDAGRIGSRAGSGSGRSVEQRIKMMRNEIALFGRVVTPELEVF
ncbi:MAG: hypothetical protein AAF291_13165 [Pseudomonadota bacterium]